MFCYIVICDCYTGSFGYVNSWRDPASFFRGYVGMAYVSLKQLLRALDRGRRYLSYAYCYNDIKRIFPVATSNVTLISGVILSGCFNMLTGDCYYAGERTTPLLSFREGGHSYSALSPLPTVIKSWIYNNTCMK